MHFENIIKSLFTTLIGIVAMSLALYGWYLDELTDWQGGALGIIGFALLFMRDQIPGFLKKFAGLALNKFSGKN
jgi:TRAP-type uncharacterized transport system fused permease subunit